MSQNLVPLYIDKISGDIVASNTASNTSGYTTSNPNTNTGYEHIQLSPLLTWIIPHNGNTKRLICQIYNETHELIFADNVQIHDDNTLRILFNVPQIGSAKLVFF